MPPSPRHPHSGAFRGSMREPDAFEGIDEGVRGNDSTFHTGAGGDAGEHLTSTSAWTDFGPNTSGGDRVGKPLLYLLSMDEPSC
jgi:hypothetical protein